MAAEHNRHSIGGSNYHFQFTPKYRKAIFRVGRVRNMIKALLEYKAHRLGVQVEAIEFEGVSSSGQVNGHDDTLILI